MTELVDFLHRVSLFDGFEDTVLSRIAAVLTPVELRAGETLFREGDDGRDIYFVVDGELDVLVNQPGGGLRGVARLGACQFVGEMGLVVSGARMATTLARTGIWASPTPLQQQRKRRRGGAQRKRRS